ncbi:phage virion morphogenesis protein [Aeromonas jandaei]
MISLTINQGSMLNVQERLDAASLPPAKRRRITQQIGREVAKVNRQRIRAGKAPDGSKWAPTKSKRKHKRLTGLSKRLRSRGTEDAAIIDFDTHFVGMLANQHHQGMTWPMAKRRGGSRALEHNEPCTKFQAVRLRELGYTARIKRGKRTRTVKPSLKWMRENLTMGKAGIIIRAMGHYSSKSTWTQKTPPRPMLSTASNDELMVIAAQQ